MTDTTDLKFADLLAAVTDALLAQQQDIDHIVRQYDVPRSSVDGLISLIHRLHLMLVGQQPSDKFVRRLKQDLVGGHSGVIHSLRYLPARVQIAAGVALVAGFMLFARRRLIDDAKPPEVPLLQQ